MTNPAPPRGRPPHRLDADDLGALHAIRHARAEAARAGAELDAAIDVAVARGIPAAVIATAAGVHRVTIARRSAGSTYR